MNKDNFIFCFIISIVGYVFLFWGIMYLSLGVELASATIIISVMLLLTKDILILQELRRTKTKNKGGREYSKWN